MFWVFNTVFKARMPDGTAFLPYLLSGVLLMSLFNQGLTMAADAIASGAGVLTKIYVRPEIFAFSATISSAINFLFGLVPLTLVLAISHKWPGWQFPLVIVVIVCMTLFTTGMGLMLAIAYVNFDDMRSLIQIVLLALQYMTPVFYPLSALGPHTKRVIELNPLTSYLSVFRDIFGDNYVASTSNWMMMIASSIVMFCVGFYIFQNKWASVVAKI
jgi:ABC-type polysaccharide/polyol phosphate export permease